MGTRGASHVTTCIYQSEAAPAVTSHRQAGRIDVAAAMPAMNARARHMYFVYRGNISETEYTLKFRYSIGRGYVS